MKRFLVRYVEEAVHENYFWNENPNDISPRLEGIFILTSEEIEMLGQWKEGDIKVNEKDVYRFSEENLSIVSEDEGKITLFEKWMPNGGGFPWRYYLIDVRIEEVIEMAFCNLHNNLDEVTEMCKPNDIIQKSLEDVDLKGGWKKIYEEYIRYFDVIDDDAIECILNFKAKCKLVEEKNRKEAIKNQERIKKRNIWANMSSLQRIQIMNDEGLAEEWHIAMWGEPKKKRKKRMREKTRKLKNKEKGCVDHMQWINKNEN